MAANPFTKPAVSNAVPGIVAPSFAAPWLLYAYPWMPYPRRVITYLREKGIPETQVKVVQCDITSKDNEVVGDFPPRPIGSLPILAIPSTAGDADEHGRVYIRQSLAIMYFLEELCNDFQYGFAKGRCGSLLGKPGTGPLERARIAEVMSLADELTAAWNPVRMFGTNAGTMSFPAGAKEMLRWERRAFMTLERYLQGRDMSLLRAEVLGHATMADIVLFQFFEFVEDCYGVDMTIGSGEIVKDVYGKDVKEEFPTLVEFYQNFKTRESAKRIAEKGEVPPGNFKKNMSTWAEGVL